MLRGRETKIKIRHAQQPIRTAALGDQPVLAGELPNRWMERWRRHPDSNRGIVVLQFIQL
jgi:hypothetical protein